MALTRALAELENRPGGAGLPDLEANTDADRLRQFTETNGGLPIERDCREEVLAVGDDDLAETILPLCTWLKNLAQAEGVNFIPVQCTLSFALQVLVILIPGRAVYTPINIVLCWCG